MQFYTIVAALAVAVPLVAAAPQPMFYDGNAAPARRQVQTTQIATAVHTNVASTPVASGFGNYVGKVEFIDVADGCVYGHNPVKRWFASLFGTSSCRGAGLGQHNGTTNGTVTRTPTATITTGFASGIVTYPVPTATLV